MRSVIDYNIGMWNKIGLKITPLPYNPKDCDLEELEALGGLARSPCLATRSHSLSRFPEPKDFGICTALKDAQLRRFFFFL